MRAVEQVQLDNNVGVEFYPGCTGVFQRPSGGFSDDEICCLPGIPIEVLIRESVRDLKWCTAVPKCKQRGILKDLQNSFLESRHTYLFLNTALAQIAS